MLPGLDGTFGNETIQPHALQHFGGDLRGGTVLTLMDVWVLNPSIWSQMDVVSWVPVDHDPVPPAVKGFFEQTDAIPIAMSRFGQERLAPYDPLYVPHSVDTSVFKATAKTKARERLKVEQDAFVVGMVAANKGNPSRKCFVEALEAFAALRQEHQNAYLYLHADIRGELSVGVPIGEVITALQIPDEAVRIVDQYRVNHRPLAPESMALMYSTMDVLLSPSAGEGFGIPVLEAASCGVPAIVTDFSAMPELCGAGWQVKGTRVWTPQRSWQMRPDVPDIIEALRHAYSLSPAARKKLREAARQHALGYDVQTVLDDYMLPALAEAQRRFDERAPMKIEALEPVAA